MRQKQAVNLASCTRKPAYFEVIIKWSKAGTKQKEVFFLSHSLNSQKLPNQLKRIQTSTTQPQQESNPRPPTQQPTTKQID